MTPEQFVSFVNGMVTDYERALQPLNSKIGFTAKSFFDNSFRNEGFTDEGLEPWKKRANNRRPNQPILVKTGMLKSSTAFRTHAGGVKIVNDTPYGIYHNKPDGQVLRQFIGHSATLNRLIVAVIERHIGRALKTSNI